MKTELKVIADFYDFMIWLIRHTEKFPRHHRHSLGVAMENRPQTILSLLLRARYSKAKAEPLTQANFELEMLRFQLRLAEGAGGEIMKRYGGLWNTLVGWGEPCPGGPECSAEQTRPRGSPSIRLRAGTGAASDPDDCGGFDYARDDVDILCVGVARPDGLVSHGLG